MSVFHYIETFVGDDVKLLFMCSGVITPCFDPITQNGMNAGLIKQKFYWTNIVSIFY
jgi:hypothetical protein